MTLVLPPKEGLFQPKPGVIWAPGIYIYIAAWYTEYTAIVFFSGVGRNKGNTSSFFFLRWEPSHTSLFFVGKYMHLEDGLPVDVSG